MVHRVLKRKTSWAAWITLRSGLSSPERMVKFGFPVVLFFLYLTIYTGLADPNISIELVPVVAAGLEMPVYLTHAGDGSGRLFVVELSGRIRVIDSGDLLEQPFLTIQDSVKCCAEQGLFSVAFDPDYESNGEFYVNYTNRKGDSVIARYTTRDPSASVADPVKVTSILVIDQPYFNHNGGLLKFSPRDGYLYIGMGDGGGSGDPEERGQNMNTLLGKMLRIDVRGKTTYTIPASNPFAAQEGVRPEIWASGLRNPWRFSFDRLTGDLYLGDVGAVCYEEIDIEPAGDPGGRNYGWSRMEGFHAFNREEASLCAQPRVSPPGLTLPVYQYSHKWGTAITGGYVYRGREYPELHGVYFFGDFGSGRIWALLRGPGGKWHSVLLLDTDLEISSFGEDETGELYVLDIQGGVYRIAGVGE
jgi:glucose/arabinose dehydrogenase